MCDLADVRSYSAGLTVPQVQHYLGQQLGVILQQQQEELVLCQLMQRALSQ